MNPSIPVSTLISVIPRTILAGSPTLGTNGVILTQDTSIPVGTLQGFTPGTEAAWFGPNATETLLAGDYTAAFVGATRIPPVLYFAQWPTSNVAAYLRGGTVAALTLTQIQAYSGTISIAVDGISIVSASINLASASSFTNAAALIQTGIRAGTPSNTVSCTYDTLRQAFVITSSTTGGASTVAFPTDSSLSPLLFLNQATGAVLSQGSAALTPAAIMNIVVAQSQDWATFMTVSDPDSGSPGGTIKQAFATWNAGQNSQYVYVSYDSDPTAANTFNDTASYGQKVASLNGTVVIWDATQGNRIAAAFCGMTAAIDFTAPGGRISYAYKASPTIVPTTVSANVASNLQSNGYNFYGGYATRTQPFQWFQRGTITGPWKWADAYVNQIYWNSVFQNDLALYESQSKSIPYNQQGYGGLSQSMMSDIQAMGSFGAWSTGVSISSSQAAQVNADAGIPIASTLQQQGWYLLIADPGPTVRAVRGSPVAKFYYTDAGSVGVINLTSTDVQ